MTKTIKVMRVSYPDIRVPQWQGRRLRGFFGAEQEAGSLLHNHGADGPVYRYPLVQYKVLGGVPTVLAAEEGIPLAYPLVMEREHITLGEQTFERGELRFDLRKETLGDCEEARAYRFLSPWFALNQENHRVWQESAPEERNTLLERILVGNILSFAKGFGLTVENRLRVSAELESNRSRFKDGQIVSFRGGFTVNYKLPDLFGLGKSVSRGFGAVRRVYGKQAQNTTMPRMESRIE